MKLLENHLEFYRKLKQIGYSLTPLYGFNDDSVPQERWGKAPKLPNWSKITPDYADSLFEHCNAGWVIPKGCVVLDCDFRSFPIVHQKEPLKYIIEHYPTLGTKHKFFIRTGNGVHIYYKLPLDLVDKLFPEQAGQKTLRIKNSITPGIELKHYGQQVVAPGSTHLTGNIYTVMCAPQLADMTITDLKLATPSNDVFLNDTELAFSIVNLPEIPNDLLDKYLQKVTPANTTFNIGDEVTDNKEAISKARAYLERAEPAIEGENGDNRTFTVLATLFEFGLSKAKVTELIEPWNSKCTPPWTQEELFTKITNAYRYMSNRKGNRLASAQFEPIETPAANAITKITANAETIGGSETNTGPSTEQRDTDVKTVPILTGSASAVIPPTPVNDNLEELLRPDYGKNEILNATIFIERKYPGKRLIFYRNSFYTFEGTYWAERSVQDLESQLQFDMALSDKIFKTSIIAATMRAVKNYTNALQLNFPGKLILTGDQISVLPLKDNLINFPNGVLNLRECMIGNPDCISPHQPDILFKGVLDYDYDPKATSPRWFKFLDEVFGSDETSKLLLQQWFGYNLTLDNSRQKFMVLAGTPRSGKSTIMAVMEKVVGYFDSSQTSLQSLAGDFGLASLLHRKMALIGEVQEDLPREYHNKFVQLIKSITGGSAVQINIKHKDASEHKIYNRFTIAFNGFPDWIDASGALGNRMLLLAFKVSRYGRENWRLVDELKEEASGIFNWALEGLKDLELADRFIEPAGSVDFVQEFERSSSPLKTFIKDRCNYPDTAGEKIQTSEIYDAYREWCSLNNMRPLSLMRFARALRTAAPNIENVQWKPRNETKRVRGYLGVSLKLDG